MLFPTDTQTVATRFAPYLEELHDFFAGHGMHFGSPQDLIQLSRSLHDPGAFPGELSSMVRSIILREGGHMPRTELLMLVAVSSGGARIAGSAQDLQEPMSQLMDFLTGVMRNPRNQPAWMSSEEQASQPADQEASSDQPPADPAVPQDPEPAGPSFVPPSDDLLQDHPGAEPVPEKDAEADPLQPGHPARNVYSRFTATTKTTATTYEDVAPDAPRKKPGTPIARKRVAGAVTLLLLIGAGLAAWRAMSRNTPAQGHMPPTTSAPPGFIKPGQAGPLKPGQAPNSQIATTPTAHTSGQTPTATKPTAATEAEPRSGSPSSAMAPVTSSAAAAAQGPTPVDGTSLHESLPATRTGAASPGADETNAGVSGRRTARGQQRWLNISSGVMAGNLISAPPPEYPKLASFAHVQGPVLMQAVISRTGTVENLHVIRGHRLLRSAAAAAVRKWRYRPYFVNGRAVEVATIVSVDFKLHR